MSQTRVATVTDDFATDEGAAQRSVVDGPVLSTIVKLASPTVLVLAAQSLVGVAETWYVSFVLDASMSTLFAIVGGSLAAFFGVAATALSAGTTVRGAPDGKNL